MKTSNRAFVTRLAIATAMVCVMSVGFAHEESAHAAAKAAKPEQTAWGIAGSPKAVSRTVEIRMLDTMRFSPDKLNLKQGETVRFVVRNEGSMLHELVIGTKAVLDQHAAMMAKFPDMTHSAAYMAHVGPGATKELIWTFNRAGDFDFACLIAGHYQAGMRGQIVVTGKS
ncbi:cupredoxin family protein [Uliginosibacterium sp. H3]|uniref:Cupredoxin family protein n=1 Tax=Uliginosibacterium silvisoli TaxID=3114758 RepID=A0ABU6JXC7_9RHOO|nr:cupredoxin family protein [Uliginosibacterium sp. H3]